MRTHQQIDERSLAMARAIVAKIDEDPARAGLAKARSVCERWHRTRPSAANQEWMEILKSPWEDIREVLLDESEEGKRRRQSDPFCGILTPQERWAIYRQYNETRKP
jgi:hypothetical protein